MQGGPESVSAAAELLRIGGLTLTMPSARGPLRLLHGVDIAMREGEIMGLVGESGSGKSLTCRSVLGLVRGGATFGGSIRYRGTDLLGLDEEALVALRGSEIAMIVQEPQSALNPVRTVGRQMLEALLLSGGTSKSKARTHAIELLREVGLPDPERRFSAFPHELSGGQAQRVLIAMMLARGPRLLLADEPTTALDVTVQAQILSLLKRLRADRGMGVLLVTHDLSVVAETCDTVAVMYCGRVVESGPAAATFRRPRHPYTAGLLAARPKLGRRVQSLPAMPGTVPDPAALPRGCAFAPRCARALPVCSEAPPPWTTAGANSGFACFHPL